MVPIAAGYYFPLLVIASLISPAFARVEPVDESDFDWASISPSQHLYYHDCFDGLQCARLLLPLDWLDENNTATVAIAIIKLPAVVDDDDPLFGGTIFAQPGGPGVSGTLTGRQSTYKYRNIVDIPGERHYEILSFDPRGIGHSTPRIDCFPSELRSIWALEYAVRGSLDSSPAALAFGIAQAKADALQCEHVHDDFLSYIGTPNVARDMVAILDEIDSLRQANKKRHHGHSNGQIGLQPIDVQSEDPPRLQYIGISYGTYLGMNFASMFPARVGRMVLDGIVDASEYHKPEGWLGDTMDVDTMVDIFFQGCFDAGPSVCALVDENDVAGVDIKRRFWAWADVLDDNPLFTVWDDGIRTFLRAGDIRAVIMATLSDIVLGAQALATDLDEAMRGNSTAIFGRVRAMYGIGPLENFHSPSDLPILSPDGFVAILCADLEDVSARDIEFWRNYLDKHLATSAVAGSVWASMCLRCAGWQARPNQQFRGPFSMPEPSDPSSPELGRPAAPILFMSNRYDPVTPLRNARKMVGKFPRSGLLIQESMGHCAVRGPIGPCVKSTLATYFDTGVVSEEMTSCEPAYGPWDRL